MVTGECKIENGTNARQRAQQRNKLMLQPSYGTEIVDNIEIHLKAKPDECLNNDSTPLLFRNKRIGS